MSKMKTFSPSPKKPFNIWGFLVLILIHGAFGIALKSNSSLGNIHAYAVFGIGVIISIMCKNKLPIIYVVAYILTSEVLWRTVFTEIFWESGKYFISALMIIGLFRFWDGKSLKSLIILYFLLLIPSIFSMEFLDRQAISFNLSGPFTLMISVIFFSNVRIEKTVFLNLLAISILPVITLAIYIIGKMMVYDQIVFGSSSNFQTSGDFGPNQVAVTLAFGSLVAFYMALMEKSLFIKTLLVVITVWLLAQSGLTFSRSGVWLTSISIFITAGVLIIIGKNRSSFLLLTLATLLLIIFAVLPYLNTLTENTISARFADLEPTGRMQIIQADMIAFQQNLFFGVGPSGSQQFHALTFRVSNSHTEYSRLLAEHGLLGAGSLLILFTVMISIVIRKTSWFNKAYTIGLMVWAALFMTVSGMRLALPSVLIGLSFAQFSLDEEKESK